MYVFCSTQVFKFMYLCLYKLSAHVCSHCQMTVDIKECFVLISFHLCLLQVLQVMRTATNALSSGNLPTASLILPLKATILKQLDGIEEQDQGGDYNPTIHEVKETLKNDLMTR